MDIRELKYFLIVAREGNLTKAAQYLYITQPSLTRQMQNLEKEVGCPLFSREGKKMVLTETGLFLEKRAKEIISLYEKTQLELHPTSDDISGDIYIGSGESYSFSNVVKAMVETNKLHPNIHFHIHSNSTEELSEKLDKGLIDFGVLVEPYDISKYDFLRLPLADRWGVLMRNDSPLSSKESIDIDDLVSLPMIVSNHIWKSNNSEVGKITRNLNVVATYNLIYNASLMVESGYGYALCLAGIINTKGSNLSFVPLNPKTVSFINICWKKNQVFSNAAKAFLQILQKNLIHYNNYK